MVSYCMVWYGMVWYGCNIIFSGVFAMYHEGGNTPSEVDSGLFIYSKAPLFATPPSPIHNNTPPGIYRYSFHDEHMRIVSSRDNAMRPRTLQQVDLAPTLAALDGHAIPYTSLGMVIPELLYVTSERVAERYNQLLLSREGRDGASAGGDTLESECVACLAAYRADPLSFHLHQNAIQVRKIMMSILACMQLIIIYSWGEMEGLSRKTPYA